MKQLTFTSLLLLVLTVGFAQVKPKRIALVVGVSNYENAGKLHNTLNDANDMSTKLELLGYSVVKILDAEIKEMTKKIDSITKAIKKEDIFLFYFSGHGAEYNGDNYLFLKNSNPTSPTDMPYETYPLGKLIGKIDYYNIKTNIILLDACRSNPFVKSWNKNGIVKEGLANVDAPSGTFIGFAASPGKTASDGQRKNGTYTEAILKFIETKNITIDQLFNKVNKEVRTESKGQQIPFKNSSLEDDFYFSIDSNFSKTSIIEQNESNAPFITAQLNRPKFPMPSIMKGYHNETLNSFALATINKTTFDKKEFIELSLKLLGDIIWDKTTPIYVEIVQRKTPTSVYMVYGEQFQPSSKNVNIKIASSFESGEYELTFGFYLINELNQEYPAFYSKKFKINIL
jgi:hypothetical protein